MKNMTDEQIKAMVGTEFLYILGSRTTFPAVIAAFDPKIGLTCLAISLIDSNGEDCSHDVDDNGNLCLVGYDSEELKNRDSRAKISFTLRSIKHLGQYIADSSGGFGYGNNGGYTVCSF